MEKKSASDLDTMIPEATLKTLREKFHARYHSTYAPQDDPTEKLISRLSREIDKRDLSPKDLWTVQSIAAKQRAAKRRRELAPGLSWDDEQEDFEGYRGATTFLSQLAIYLLGLAKAGVVSTDKPTSPELPTTPSTEVVLVPLDTVTRYLSRARRESDKVVSAHRLNWLESQHGTEVEAWIYRFKNSSLTLGQVIEQTMTERAIFWEPPVEILITNSNTKGKSKGVGKKGGSGLGSGFAGRQAATGAAKGGKGSWGSGKSKGQGKNNSSDVLVQSGKRWLKKMLNGESLCQDFNNKKCKNWNDCPKGSHLRCLEIGPNKVCGKPHPAKECGLAWQ